MFGNKDPQSSPIDGLQADAPVKPSAAAETLRLLEAHRESVAEAPAAAAEAVAAAARASSEADAAAFDAEREAGKAQEQAEALGRGQRRGDDRGRRMMSAGAEPHARARRQQQRELGEVERVAREASSTAEAMEKARQRAQAELERQLHQERQRAESEQALRAQAMAAQAAAAAKALQEETRRKRQEEAKKLRSVGEIFSALLPVGVRPRDAHGDLVKDYLLNSKFEQGVASKTERRKLLSAASALTHTVLSMLAPGPLATAAYLARPMTGTAAPDPLRVALATAGFAELPRKQQRQVLASSGMAQDLIYSLKSAQALKAPTGVIAQILSPFPASFSLSSFNSCFNMSITRHTWRYARWHASVHLAAQARPARAWQYESSTRCCSRMPLLSAAQTPIQSKTERWRLKGGGADGTLPHEAITRALDFLTSPDNLQHTAFDSRRVKKSNGQWVELPDTQRKACAEALWKAYAATHEVGEGEDKEDEDADPPELLDEDDDDGSWQRPSGAVLEQGARGRRLSRSYFLHLANLVAGSTQQAYGALDTFSEHNG